MAGWKRARAQWIEKNRRKLDHLVPSMSSAELRALARQDAMERLREVRDAWEAVTGRNQDLGDARLAAESSTGLKAHLAWYCSDEAKAIMATVLVEYLKERRPRG